MNMTRSEQIENAVNENWSTIENDYAEVAFRKGAEWADANPFQLSELKGTLEKMIESIKSGELKTLSQYSNDDVKRAVFDDGQVSALKLVVTWLNYKLKITN